MRIPCEMHILVQGSVALFFAFGVHLGDVESSAHIRGLNTDSCGDSSFVLDLVKGRFFSASDVAGAVQVSSESKPSDKDGS